MIGVLGGNVLGPWLVWRHDVLLDFAINGPLIVLGESLALPAVIAILLGLAVVAASGKIYGATGAWKWGPVAAATLAYVATGAVWSYFGLANPSTELLFTILVSSAVMVAAIAGLKIYLES